MHDPEQKPDSTAQEEWDELVEEHEAFVEKFGDTNGNAT